MSATGTAKSQERQVLAKSPDARLPCQGVDARENIKRLRELSVSVMDKENLVALASFNEAC